MSFSAASLAAIRTLRDLFSVAGEVIDALIPSEAQDFADQLAEAEAEREVWEPGDQNFPAADSTPPVSPAAAGTTDPSPAIASASSAVGGEGPGADSSIPSGAAPGRLTSLDLFTASGVVAIYSTQVDDEATQAYLDRLSDLLAMAAADIAELEQ